nr:hypothetical protein [Pseudomonas sp. Fl5BN2]
MTTAQGPCKPCWFTEPCLEFHFHPGPHAQIEILFAHEAAPHWLDPAQKADGFKVGLPLANNPLQALLVMVDALRQSFPVR